MPLIVEDGTGRADALALCSYVYATAYHAARGNAAWALLTQTEGEQALVRATDYMRAVYGPRWAGFRSTLTQAQDWPRQMVPVQYAAGMPCGGVAHYAFDSVPSGVADACAALALRASAGELAPDVGRLKSRERIEGAIDVEYEKGAAPWVRFRAVDNMLAPFLTAVGFSIALHRV